LFLPLPARLPFSMASTWSIFMTLHTAQVTTPVSMQSATRVCRICTCIKKVAINQWWCPVFRFWIRFTRNLRARHSCEY